MRLKGVFFFDSPLAPSSRTGAFSFFLAGCFRGLDLDCVAESLLPDASPLFAPFFGRLFCTGAPLPPPDESSAGMLNSGRNELPKSGFDGGACGVRTEWHHRTRGRCRAVDAFSTVPLRCRVRV